MSRYITYPPPGYARIPVAVAVAEAEPTAKPQKEREKVEKKKEKRSDRKALQQGVMSKHSKHSHKKRKHGDVSPAAQEPKKVSKEPVEQLEKSGLTEEHGAPCFTQTVRDSPESSQDSSKRRKVILPSPSQAKNGNIVRIKIKRNQDSPAPVLEKPRVLAQPSVQQMGLSSLLSKQISIQHHNKGNGRSAAAHRINGDSQGVQKRVITEPPPKIMQRAAPQPAVEGGQLVDHQLSVKATVGTSDVLPPMLFGSTGPSSVRAAGRSDPQPVKMTQRVQPPPAKILQKDPQLPYEEIQRKRPAVGTNVAEKEFRSPAVRVPDAPQLPVLHKTKDLPVLKQQQGRITSLPIEEPCFSGRNAEAAPVQEVKLSRSDRKKLRKAEKKLRKAEKKLRKAEEEEKKYRDLFVNWNPVPMEVEGSDLGEQDWLFGGTMNSDASVSSRASDSSVPTQSMQQQLSLQPRATFLQELNMYQLPYVIPF